MAKERGRGRIDTHNITSSSPFLFGCCTVLANCCCCWCRAAPVDRVAAFRRPSVNIGGVIEQRRFLLFRAVIGVKYFQEVGRMNNG